LLLTLKIKILLKRLISCISFGAFNVLTMSKLRINANIFITFILYIFFVSFFFLIYVINFIFLINCRFKNAYLTFILIVVYAINIKTYIMLAYVFASCVFFLIFFNFFNRFVVFFNFFNTKIISICLFFAKSLLNLRVNFLTKMHYLINVVIKINFKRVFFLDL